MTRTKVFMDMEFTGLQQDTDLISIGCESDAGTWFYMESDEFREELVNDWIRDNVIANLSSPRRHSISGIGDSLATWLAIHEQVEIWGDCLSYDWVLFCELFGGAFNIPPNVYYIPFDICTLFKLKGIDPDIDRESFADLGNIGTKHNALWDAHVIKGCYEKLMVMP